MRTFESYPRYHHVFTCTGITNTEDTSRDRAFSRSHARSPCCGDSTVVPKEHCWCGQMQITSWPLVLQIPLAEACPELPPSSAWADALDREGVTLRKVWITGSPQEEKARKLSLRKSTWESGTPYPPCCPDPRPGGSDSVFGPRSPAAGGRRPRTVTRLTHASSWLSPSWDQRSTMNCSPSLRSLPPILLAKGFPPSTLLILVGQRKSLPQVQKHLHAEVTAVEKGTHTENYLWCWKLKALFNSIGYSAPSQATARKNTITHTLHLLRSLGKHDEASQGHPLRGERRSIPCEGLGSSSLSQLQEGGRYWVVIFKEDIPTLLDQPHSTS